MSYELLPEHPQDSPEWHRAREGTLGASEVAAVLGLSPWQTPLSVWRTKQGVPNEIPEDLAYFGHALEPVIARWVEDKHPEVGFLTSVGISVRSVEHPWLTATPDRLVLETEPLIPVELKTSSAYSRSSWDEGVPNYYKIQSLVQQGILGADHGWLAVLHGGNSPELYRIDFDPAVWEQIVRITGEWWQKYIIEGAEPAPSNMDEVKDAFNLSGSIPIEGDDRLLAAWYLDGIERATLKEAKANSDVVADAFKELLLINGGTELTYGGKKLYTFRKPKPGTKFDVDSFKSEHPELHDQYLIETDPAPRFTRTKVEELEAEPPAGWQPGTRVADVLAEYNELRVWKQSIKEQS